MAVSMYSVMIVLKTLVASSVEGRREYVSKDSITEGGMRGIVASTLVAMELVYL